MATTTSNPIGTEQALDCVNVSETPSNEINLLDLLIELAQHRRTIFRVTLGTALLAVGVSLLLPNRYTATAKILPPQQNQSLAASLMGQLGPLGSMAGMGMAQGGLLKNPNDIYLGMLKSRTVEDALIRRFDLLKVYHDKKMSDGRGDLEAASSIALGKEGFISISVEDRNPRRAADIANAYVEELRRLTQSFAVTEAGQRRLFFEEQLRQAKDNLSNAEKALKETQETTGIIQLDGQAKAIIDSVVTLRAQVAAKEVQLRAMRAFATEQNPEIIRVEQELTGIRAQLASITTKSGGDGDIQVATEKIPEAGLQYLRKVRDVKYYETIFELLAKQYEAAKLDEAKDAPVIQVLDPAIEPDRKSSPKRSLFVAIAAVQGGALAIVLILGRAFIMRMESSSKLFEKLRVARPIFSSVQMK